MWKAPKCQLARSAYLLFKSFILLIYWKFDFYFSVDTEIPIIKHSSSPPALPTHNQPQQLSHQNQQQTHHQTQRNHLQTSHHHQQQQKQVSVSLCVCSKCKNVNFRFPLHSDQMEKLIDWYCSIISINHFNHCFRFYISLNSINRHENKTINTIFVRFFIFNSNSNSYRIDHCYITYWVERLHHITEIIVHRVQVSVNIFVLICSLLWRFFSLINFIIICVSVKTEISIILSVL